MKSLKKHNVYTLVPLSSVLKKDKILGTKFVFKKKLDGRFKARLVVGGHRQEAGYDYGRSYAPVCRIGSIRSILAIANELKWIIFQLDVVGAFLNAPCDRDAYIRPAPGETHKDPETGEPMVYKLERSLNGVSQSPAQGNDTLDATLSAFGWKLTQSDPCVYTYTDARATGGDNMFQNTLYPAPFFRRDVGKA
eukprot:g19901.t1